MSYIKASGTNLLWNTGAAVHEVGLNGYSLFWRVLDNNSDTTYVTAFSAMRTRGIRVLRVALCPWSDNSFFESSLAAWRVLVDAFMSAAQNANIVIIWSLFFNYAGIPAWKGETTDAWANASSATKVHANAVIDEITSRYVNHPALGGYEMGNEWDASCSDLGGAGGVFTSTVLGTAFSVMATRIKAADANRIVMSGNSGMVATVPANEHALVAQLLLTNPSPMDTVTLHPYRPYSTWNLFVADNYSGIRGFLAIAKRVGKAVVVGEFGVNETDTFTDSTTVASAWARALFDVTASGLALAWNMDISDYSGNQTGWFSWAGNNRQYVLDGVGNARVPTV